MSHNETINWSSCCICGEKGNLRSTNDGIQSLANRFTEFWKNNVLPFSSSKITTDTIVNEDGNECPDFKSTMLKYKAKYHHNCVSRFTPYHMERRKGSLLKKLKKTENNQILPTHGSRASVSRHAPSCSDTNPICVICGEMDILDNLVAAGTLHAGKNKVNSEHDNSLTEKWREIAIYLEDSALSSRLMIGSLSANSSFYHRQCGKNLFNRVRQKRNNETKTVIDSEKVKEGAWDKVIAFMNESSISDAANGFEIHDLENMYIDYLTDYDIHVVSHITRFSNELIKRAPTYQIIKNDET